MSQKPQFHWGRATGMPADDLGVVRLREALQRNPQVGDWKLESQRTTAHQLYLARTEIEAIRQGTTESITATVYVPIGDKVGSATVLLRPGEEAAAERKVAEAVALAGSAEVRSFPLAGSTQLPEVTIEDPGIARDPEHTLHRAYEQLIGLVQAERNLRLASAELFLAHEVTRFENSQGLTADRSGTRVTAEVVLIGLGENQSEAETQGLRYRRRVEDLELDDWVVDLAAQSRDKTWAQTAQRFEGPVIILADSIPQLLGPFQFHTSAESKFQGMTTWELQQPISEEPPRGDGLTLYHDALIAYGNQSAPCDVDGVPGQRALLIENGFFRHRWADLRYAHYTNVPATGQFANWAIEGGSQAEESLRHGPSVLEVKRFSDLTPSRATGDFAAEIRFGYLHRNGQRIPIKGGVVAGNVFEAFGDCQFSRETRFVGDGQIPAAIRFNRLLVSGG